MSKTVLFHTIQFSISTYFSSIWPIDCTRSGATPSSQSGPGSDGNEGVLRTPQSSCSITGTSLSDCLVSYPEHSLVESYLSAEMQSVYSAAPDDWATLAVRGSFSSAEIQPVYSRPPAFWAILIHRVESFMKHRTYECMQSSL